MQVNFNKTRHLSKTVVWKKACAHKNHNGDVDISEDFVDGKDMKDWKIVSFCMLFAASTPVWSVTEKNDVQKIPQKYQICQIFWAMILTLCW